jgi:hypothetical protein
MNRESGNRHPAQWRRSTGRPTKQYSPQSLKIPDVNELEITIADRTVKLTNLRKVFWEKPRITKGDLIRYYAAMAHLLLPHLRDRAM